jgi:hypothetical protein
VSRSRPDAMAARYGSPWRTTDPGSRGRSGDAKGSADAFEKAWRTHGWDPEALRFLLQAVGSALPGRDRWEKVWQGVSFRVDRSHPASPVVRVQWPGVPGELCPCSGVPMDVDFKEADLQDVFRLIADTSGLNMVVMPGTQGAVTFRAVRMPWDQHRGTGDPQAAGRSLGPGPSTSWRSRTPSPGCGRGT